MGIDDAIFIKAFGGSAINKALIFLLDNHEFDYSKSDIAKNCGISRATLDGFFERLVVLGIAAKTRQVGRAELYKINFQSPIVKELAKLNEIVASGYAEKLLGARKAYA